MKKESCSKQSFREEFGMEFGDINAVKQYEILQRTKEKSDKKKKC
ncbi:hypothetical protein [Falsibacillus pallidus]